MADERVGIRRLQDELEKINKVRLGHLLDLLPIVDRAALKQNIGVFTDDPNGTQGKRVLRQIGRKSRVEPLSGVELEFGSVAD